MIIRGDLHTHLLEKKVNPRIYAKYVKHLKLDFIAITEHSWLDPKKAYFSLKQYLDIIPGVELETNKGHILLFGDEDIYNNNVIFGDNIDFWEVFDFANDENYILSVAHPWGYKKDSFGYIDEKTFLSLVNRGKIGVEVYNGIVWGIMDYLHLSYTAKKIKALAEILSKLKIKKLDEKIKEKIGELVWRNESALKLSSHAKIITAGSDAHYPSMLGKGIIALEAESKKKDDVFEALRKKKVIWFGPFVREISPGIFKKEFIKFGRREGFEAFKYVLKHVLKRGKRHENKAR